MPAEWGKFSCAAGKYFPGCDLNGLSVDLEPDSENAGDLVEEEWQPLGRSSLQPDMNGHVLRIERANWLGA